MTNKVICNYVVKTWNYFIVAQSQGKKKNKQKHLFEIKLLGKNSHASLLPHWLDTAELRVSDIPYRTQYMLIQSNTQDIYFCSKPSFRGHWVSKVHFYPSYSIITQLVKPVVLLHNPEPRFWSGFGHKHRVTVLAAKSVHCSHRRQDSSLFTVNVR